jgi:acyl-CoA thioester hydrolase
MARQEPETRDRFPHFVSITTRWMDNDVYQHINNVHYYSFFDTAVNEYMMRRGVLDLQDCPVIGLVVETGCQCFPPIPFPTRCTADCVSLILAQAASDSKLASSATTTDPLLRRATSCT